MRTYRLGAAMGALIFASAAVTGPVLASSKVHLPTRKDASTVAPGAETILNGNAAIETQLPGRVEDEELIKLVLGEDGSPAAIIVDQRLKLHGVGDFSFKVPGPAQDVQALPGSGQQPGLRKGSVIWQGFSAGKEILAARMPLFPEQERTRLPLDTSFSLQADGKPVAPGDTLDGDLELKFTVANSTSSLTAVKVGEGDKTELASALDAIGAELKKGHRPAPGSAGIPKEVTVLGGLKAAPRFIEVPFHVKGEFVFPARGAAALAEGSIEAEGAEVVTRRDGVHVRFDSLLGGGEPSALSIHVRGRATGLEYPKLEMTALPAAPSFEEVRPPRASSWQKQVADDPGAVSGKKMLALIMDTLWQTAKLTRFDAYLGNPDRFTGESSSVYVYKLAAPKVTAATPVVLTLEVSPWLTVAALLALLLLLFDLTLLWSLS